MADLPTREELRAMVAEELRVLRNRKAPGMKKTIVRLELMKMLERLTLPGDAPPPEAKSVDEMDWKEREKLIKAEKRATEHH